jgi:DNA-binding transcriptional ArsR family regulator
MPESEDVFEEVKKIRWHQEAIDSNMELLTRAHGKEILNDIMGFFGNVPGKKKKTNLARVYLAVDGVKTVGAIATALKMKVPNVSTEISKLKEMSLIEVKDVVKEGIIYKKRKVDTLLRISQKLIKDFGLDKIPTQVENAEPLPEPKIEDAKQEEKNE